MAIEMEIGDDGSVGPSQLGYYKHQFETASTANITLAMCASPAPTYA